MKTKKIGLVGGISWVSTVDYYRYLNTGVNARLGGLNFAECLLYSVNFDEFHRNNAAGDWQATAALLARAGNALKQGGAEALVLCANTAHAVADEVQAAVGLPLVHIVTATAEAVHRRGLRKIGLLGTKFTMEMAFYRQKLAAAGIDAVVPKDAASRDYLQQTIRDELGRGLLKPETKRAYLDIAAQLISEGAEGIVLGCTELPLLLGPADFSVPVFDTTKIHAEAAVAFAIGRV